MSTHETMKQLYTHCGTRVFMDPAVNQLKHGVAGSSPDNLFLDIRDTAAALVYCSADGLQHSVTLTPGSKSPEAQLEPVSPETFGAWSVIRLQAPNVAVACHSYFLCAEPDGDVSLSRTEVGEWEQFYLPAPANSTTLKTRRRVGLSSLPHGYFLFDDEADSAIGISWPANSVGFVHSTTILDGSWAVDAYRLTWDEDNRYELFWLRPFSALIHCWTLDGTGRRIEGHDLTVEESLDFLFQRQNEGPAYRLRLFLLLAENGTLHVRSDLPAHVANLATEANLEEAIYAVCLHPRYFRPETVDMAMVAARLHLRLARSACPPNPRTGIWAARLDAFARVASSSALPSRFDLEYEIKLAHDLRTAHETAAQHGLPPYLPQHEHFTVHQITSTEMGALCHPILGPDLVFRVEFCSSGVTPTVVSRASSTGMPHDRMLKSIGYMQMMLREQLGRPEFIEHGKACGIAPDERRVFFFQAWDGPCETDRQSVSFERSVGNQRITLVPDPYYLDSDGYADVAKYARAHNTPWSSRKPAFVWRGSTTGFTFNRDTIDLLPRYRLCKIGQSIGPAFDVGVTDIVQVVENDLDEITERLRNEGLLKPFVSQIEMGQYQYIIDIDGNANSWGFIAKMMSGSCLLKVGSRFEQWYYPNLLPWKHFVPVAQDLSDLPQVYEWCMAHPDLSEQIGQAGREFSLNMNYHEEGRKCAYELLRLSEPG